MAENDERTMEEVMKLLELQEEILQFTHFTNEDAWELGHLMVNEAKKRNLKVAIRIKLNSGLIVFQYLFDTKTLANQKWLDRKHNVVMKIFGYTFYNKIMVCNMVHTRNAY